MEMLAIQRRLSERGEAARWRTIVRVPEDKALEAMRLSVNLATLGELMELRLVRADVPAPPLMRWTMKDGWIEVARTGAP